MYSDGLLKLPIFTIQKNFKILLTVYSLSPHFFFPKLGDSQREKQTKHYNRTRQEWKHRKCGIGSFCCKIMERAGYEITAVTVRVNNPQRRIRNQYTGNHK